jgi:hypothetical protein
MLVGEDESAIAKMKETLRNLLDRQLENLCSIEFISSILSIGSSIHQIKWKRLVVAFELSNYNMTSSKLAGQSIK